MIRDRLLHVREPMRRMLVSVLGGTLLVLGVLTVLTPIPAVIFVPAGLAILSVEFVWAQRLLLRYQAASRRAANAFRHKKKLSVSPAPDGAALDSARSSAAPSVIPGDQIQTPDA